MSNINMNSTVKIKGGKSLTMPEFADRLGLDILNTSLVISTANLLERRGDLILVEKKSKDEKMLENALEEQAFEATVKAIDAEEANNKDRIRQSKLAETDSHTFDLAFATTLEATKFQIWVNNLGVNQTAIMKDEETGAVKLYIKEVTPQEYTKITTKYKAENAINSGMNVANKAVKGTTNAVNYGLTEVVAPTAKIVGEAGMNIGKGLFHTLIKTGAGLINSGAKAVTDTKIALTTDPDCLRATNQLMNVKNQVKRGINSKMNQTGGNGITNY